MYLPKHGKWPSQHLYLKINSGFHARKNANQQYLKVVTFSDPSFSKKHICVYDHAAQHTEQLIPVYEKVFILGKNKEHGTISSGWSPISSRNLKR